MSYTCRSVGQQPFHRLVPELQHPAAGRGRRAALRGKQRSSVRAQHHQHLHTCKPHSECQELQVVAVNEEASSCFSPTSVKRGRTNNSLKQIEQISLCSSSFYGYRIKCSRRLFKRVRNSENEVGCSSFFSLPVFFHRSFYISVFLPPVPELTESSLFPPIVCRLIGMLPLNRRSSV